MEATKRSRTRQVFCGGVAIGGDAPVTVQSMTTTKTEDAAATLEQIARLADAGCEIIRCAIPTAQALDGFEAIIDAAKAAGIPIRIGVNAGSLDKQVESMDGLDLSEKLVLSCESFVEHFRERGFEDIVLSAKAHDVVTTLATYRSLSERMPDLPLHVGVTEAGTLRQGTVKNACGVGILLEEGIGNTMRLSLTADPVEEVKVAWDLLSSLGMRRRTPELVSCPTCGRCQVDMIPIADEVSRRLESIAAPISVAVMGCVVNGPGEARSADIGLASGRGEAVLFAHGEIIRKVPEDAMVDELMAEIESRFC